MNNNCPHCGKPSGWGKPGTCSGWFCEMQPVYTDPVIDKKDEAATVARQKWMDEQGFVSEYEGRFYTLKDIDTGLHPLNGQLIHAGLKHFAVFYETGKCDPECLRCQTRDKRY